MNRSARSSSLLAWAYALPSLAIYSVHAVFVVYHVDLFLHVYRMSRSWLLAGELWILICSSLNEPLFGYVMSGTRGFRRHLSAIAAGGALLAAASLLPYFPLWRLDDGSGVALGAHFVLSVYVYDALLAYVTLAHASLLADITTVAAERERCNLYSAVLGAVGCSSVFVGQFYWHGADLAAFRLFALVLAVGAALAFYGSAELCERATGLSKKADDAARFGADAVVVNYGDFAASGRLPIALFLRQVRRHGNLWLFNGINFIQVLNCHFNSNFLPIFVRAFCAFVPPVVGSFVLGLSASLPHATVALLTGVVARHGAVPVVRWLIAIRLALALVALLALRPLATLVVDPLAVSTAPPSSGVVALALGAAFFLVANKMLGEAVCRHTNLILSDVIDEDTIVNGRRGSESTLIHGVAFFFSKPGQSIAPMLAMLLLGDAAVDSAEYRWRLFHMMCMVPLACTAVQTLLWTRYDLVGARLAAVRKQVSFRSA